MITRRFYPYKILNKLLDTSHSLDGNGKEILSVCLKRSFLSKSTRLIPVNFPFLKVQGRDVICKTLVRCCSHNANVTPDEKSKSLQLSLKPEEFVNFLKSEKIQRCYIVKDESGQLTTSHKQLDKLLGDLIGEPDKLHYEDHEAIFMSYGKRSGCLLSAFIWNTNRGHASGGVDFREFKSMRELITDGNKMSKNLGMKSALAGNWAGGGKGIIANTGQKQHIDLNFRQKVFQDFGDFLTSLNGCFIPGCGTGSYISDMSNMYTQTRYCVNLTQISGGTGNTAWFTGQGVVMAMEAAVDFLEMNSLEGKTVALQGAGNVGVVVIDQLLKRGVRHIHVAETNKLRVADVKDLFSKVDKDLLTISHVQYEDTRFFKQPCDIFSPCARPKVLNHQTIPLLDTRIVCGAANSPAATDNDRQMLFDNNITYVSDLIPNRMGIVAKSMELFGRMDEDPEINKHFSKNWESSIYKTTLRMLKHASENNITPDQAAYEIGLKMTEEQHPMYPGRTQGIIRCLVNTGWHEGHDYWKTPHDFADATEIV